MSRLAPALVFTLFGCTQSKSPDLHSGYQQFVITETNNIPTVDIKEYTLITTNKRFDSLAAQETTE
ncbi:MAG: hypothetical protein WBP41_03595 [Saprospiraceae bacterium]